MKRPAEYELERPNSLARYSSYSDEEESSDYDLDCSDYSDDFSDDIDYEEDTPAGHMQITRPINFKVSPNDIINEEEYGITLLDGDINFRRYLERESYELKEIIDTSHEILLNTLEKYFEEIAPNKYTFEHRELFDEEVLFISQLPDNLDMDPEGNPFYTFLINHIRTIFEVDNVNNVVRYKIRNVIS